MSKRALEQIETILESIDDPNEIEEAFQSIEKKRRLSKEKQFEKAKKAFIDARGYWVALAKDATLEKDVDMLSIAIPVTVHISSWREDDEADVDGITSKDKLFDRLKLSNASLESYFDENTLDWSKVNMDRDDYRDPFRATTKSTIYVYVKRQLAPAEQSRVAIYRNNTISDCLVRDGTVVFDSGTSETLLVLKDWPTANLFDVNALRVTEPYALFANE